MDFQACISIRIDFSQMRQNKLIATDRTYLTHNLIANKISDDCVQNKNSKVN